MPCFIMVEKIISDSALVAITLMVAESKPEEKEIMIALVMKFFNKELMFYEANGI